MHNKNVFVIATSDVVLINFHFIFGF